jgi:hypothetical protein
MDDQTMHDLFDSLKREFKQELQPLKDAVARIEAELERQISELEGQASP